MLKNKAIWQLILVLIFLSISADLMSQDLPINRSIDLNNNELKNVSKINGEPYVNNSSMLDAIKDRKLDPYVFTSQYPQVGEVIGPVYVTKDIQLQSCYGMLKSERSTESVRFNIFWSTNFTDVLNAESRLYPNDVNLYASNTGLITNATSSTTVDKGKWLWCVIEGIGGSPELFSVTLEKKER